MKSLYSASICFMLLFSLNVHADASDGNELHEESCVRCHSSDAYTRSNAKVKTLPALGTQVRFCKNSLGVSWFDEDVSDVISFLNQKYYKF